jgi:hypothetical protein
VLGLIPLKERSKPWNLRVPSRRQPAPALALVIEALRYMGLEKRRLVTAHAKGGRFKRCRDLAFPTPAHSGMVVGPA